MSSMYDEAEERKRREREEEGEEGKIKGMRKKEKGRKREGGGREYWETEDRCANVAVRNLLS